jgi:hypothetical protein
MDKIRRMGPLDFSHQPWFFWADSPDRKDAFVGIGPLGHVADALLLIPDTGRGRGVNTSVVPIATMVSRPIQVVDISRAVGWLVSLEHQVFVRAAQYPWLPDAHAN